MEQNPGYLKALKIIMNKSYYILGALALSLIACSIFLYLTTPVYSSNASIRLDERKSELSELISIKNIYDRSSKSETEKFIIYSRNVLTKAITALDYKISFFENDHFTRSNLYPKKPLMIQLFKIPAENKTRPLFKFEEINAETFKLSYTIQQHQITGLFKYGKLIQQNGFSFKILKNPIPGRAQKATWYFQFNELADLLRRVNESLKIDDNLNTNILNLTFTDPNPYFARDLLNSILIEYQKFDRSQRSLSINQTSVYIDTLLQKMSLVLEKSGLDIQRFKKGHQLLNVSSNAESLLNQLTSLETEKHNLTIQNLLNLQLQKSLQINQGHNTPNFNLQNVEDPQLITLLSKYNTLVEKRTEALPLYQPGSPYINRFNEQLADIKMAIVSNIKSQNTKNKELLSFLDQKIKAVKENIESAPGIEQDYISLQSDFNINQKVYNYLSEKKLEAHISTASVTSGGQIIDYAIRSTKPVYPVEASIYKDFILLGLISGTLLIFIVRKLNPYLYDLETIDELTSVPIIGSIRNHSGKSEDHKILSIENPKSLFSESVRAMRANLYYMVSGNNGKIVCITSEIAGEGKSFTSLNLAGTLCLIDKKVIIVATDLRKSQLHKTFETSNTSGLSSYLSGQESINKLCLTTKFENLDFIPAGPVPPNPSELIQSNRMLILLNHLKENYDFIILDSAPVGLVSDSIPLMRMADINFFVLRYGVSRRQAASLPEKLLKEFNLSNMAIVLNSFKQPHSHNSYYSLSANKHSYDNYFKPASN